MRECMFGGEDIKEVLESLHGETKYFSVFFIYCSLICIYMCLCMFMTIEKVRNAKTEVCWK